MNIVLNGPSGRLEGRLHQGAPCAPVVLLLHPNPVQGGTMDSKAVYTLYRAFARQGFGCLRINFRGVGRSDGRSELGEGEIADAAAALDWLQDRSEGVTPCWIGGVSFGAWVALQLLMRRPEIARFVVAGLPERRYDFSFFNPCPVDGLVLHGEQDELIPYAHIAQLQQTLICHKAVRVVFRCIKSADHLFSRHLSELEQATAEYIRQTHAKSAA